MNEPSNGLNSMPTARLDAIVVGAGFSGLYALYRLRRLGLTARLLEAGDDVGGTWYWNRYPGARCDVESVDYCYSFSDELQDEWEWTERYPRQAEIQRYLRHVADRFDLWPDIQLSTRVTEARYDSDEDVWAIATAGEEHFEARFCVMATGNLTSVKFPEIPGVHTFRGACYHTARWPETEVDFAGQRVGVIGTGSTGVQVIPAVAAEAERLVVFQRTPNFVVPARNHVLDDEYKAWVRRTYPERREQSRWSGSGIAQPAAQVATFDVPEDARLRILHEGWAYGGWSKLLNSFTDQMISEEANEYVAEFLRARIREVVRDPEVAAKLTPTDHPVGAKRPCVGTDYYETFNRDNVLLVDLRDTPIKHIEAAAVVTSDQRYELDCLIFATGFDAMTGALLDIEIIGDNGIALRDKWRDGPRTYLGLATRGFPNMFIVTGPGSPSVLSNMVTSIEQHVDWIADCIAHLKQQDVTRIEASDRAERAWVAHVNELANMTLFPRANSWYVGANVPGKPRVFMPYIGGVGNYRGICNEVARQGYEGFILGRARGATEHPVDPDEWRIPMPVAGVG